MKRFLCIALILSGCLTARAQVFESWFANRTLRIDYQFVGNAHEQRIAVDGLSALPQWAGRHHHLSELPLRGNGEVTLKDVASGTLIYRTSFSSLFQEWLTTDEAKLSRRSFENSFLLPMPLRKAMAEVKLYNSRGETVAKQRHLIDPTDILIEQKGTCHITPHTYLLESGNAAECIDVAILAEGYTEAEMELFMADSRRACESLFSHEPFKELKARFNVVAVRSASADSGVSIPKDGKWKRTAFGSHFSTFYSDRYLTTPEVKRVHDALAGIPYEHIIILANTDEYGGGGIYNSYTLTAAHHQMFAPVVAHEFGHSFGGLADEYFYEEDVMTDTYPLDVEPWEQNITTRVDFESKWQDMLPEDTPVPTPPADAQRHPVGVYEGGGYSFKGVFRPADDCRMRTNSYPTFCPVCQRALKRMINFYTLE